MTRDELIGTLAAIVHQEDHELAGLSPVFRAKRLLQLLDDKGLEIVPKARSQTETMDGAIGRFIHASDAARNEFIDEMRARLIKAE